MRSFNVKLWFHLACKFWCKLAHKILLRRVQFFLPTHQALFVEVNVKTINRRIEIFIFIGTFKVNFQLTSIRKAVYYEISLFFVGCWFERELICLCVPNIKNLFFNLFLTQPSKPWAFPPCVGVSWSLIVFKNNNLLDELINHLTASLKGFTLVKWNVAIFHWDNLSHFMT